MYRDTAVALVIPAYNEERLIRPTLEHVPDYVDRIYVVDDCSTDRMRDVIEELTLTDHRIELIRHDENQGPGAAIISGYLAAAKAGYQAVVVVGGDYQMPYDEMPNLLDPLINGEADYVKGNRFLVWTKTREKMPPLRIFANILITSLTKMASGYYKVMDVVEGYTVISKEAIELVDWSIAWKKYGYPMDFLIRLNVYGLKVKDVPRTPIYLPGERQSQIKAFRYALKVSPMLIRGFFWRLFYKYLYLNFHPLVFFYMIGLTLLPLGVGLGLHIVRLELWGNGTTSHMAILCALAIITGLQFLLFAMLFDMQDSDAGQAFLSRPQPKPANHSHHTKLK